LFVKNSEKREANSGLMMTFYNANEQEVNIELEFRKIVFRKCR